MKDKISIIMPVYNSELYLDECIKSIINQSYSNFELLIIDDGSTDGSPRICDYYSEKYDFIKTFHNKNVGVSEARNFGIKKSDGKWITFVDSDDIIGKDYCEELLKVVDDDTDLVIGRTICFSNNNLNNLADDNYRGGIIDCFTTNGEKKKLLTSIFIDNKDYYYYPHISTCSSKLMRKEILIKNNISYNKAIRLYEDALLNFNVIMKSRKIKVIDKKIYFYRYDDNSSSNRYKDDMFSQYELVYENFNNLFIHYDINFDEFMDYFKIKNLNMLLKCYCKTKNSKIKRIKEFINSDTYLNACRNVNFDILPLRRKILIKLVSFKQYFITFLMYKIK